MDVAPLWPLPARALALSLPLLALAAVAAALRTWFDDWRERWLAAATAVAVWLVLSSEVLGALGRLERGGLVVTWSLLAALAGFVARRNGAGQRTVSPSAAAMPYTPFDRGVVALLVAIAALLLLVAVATPPNTADSMSYHLSRAVHWAAQKSLALFPTHDLRYAEFAPFSSLAMFHALLLWGTDRWVQCVAWLTWVGAAVGAAALAQRLGASRRGALVAAVFAATSPVAIAQAPTARNDLVVAFWVLITALALAGANRRAGAPGSTAACWLWAGGAAGLAIHTKSSAYFFLIPLIASAALVLARSARRSSVRRSAARAAWLVLPIVAVNSGYWIRNAEVFDSPLGSSSSRDALFVHPGLAATTSNLLRHASLHADAPGLRALVPAVSRGVRSLHARLGINPDDPATSFYLPYSASASRWPGHDGPIWHWVAVATAIGLAWRRGDVGTAPALCLAAAGGAGTIALLALLRWQPWSQRFVAPALLLCAPLVGVAVGAGRSAAQRLYVVGICALLMATAVPNLWRPPYHPLLGPRGFLRTDATTELFIENPEMRSPMLAVAARLRASSCRRLGFITVDGGYEYALWRLLNGPLHFNDRFQIEHTAVVNPTRDLAAPFEPCAVVQADGATIEFVRAPPD